MTPAHQPPKPWRILALLCIPVFIGSVDLTIVSAILPEVLVTLGLPTDTRLDDAFWMVSGYLLAYTISMVFVGRLSDLVGRRQVYIGTLVLFMFGSYFVAVAHTWPADLYLRVFRELNPDARPPAEELRILHMIILGRVIQALGAGSMAPVTMAMVADLFPRGKRARPIGLVGAVDTTGWMLGHLYGGIMVNFFGQNTDAILDILASLGLSSLGAPDWRTLFWFNLVTGGFTLIAVIITLRHVPQQRLRERFDFLGTGLIIVALVGLNLGLGSTNPQAPENVAAFQTASETGSNLAAPLLIMGGIAFLLFILVETRLKHPLVNVKLFLQRNVATAGFVNVAVGFCLALGLVVLPILVNLREGEASAESIQEAALVVGLLLSGLTVPMALAALPGAWMSDQYGYRNTTTLGMLFAWAGFGLAGVTWQPDTPYGLMAAQMVLIGIGLGLTISPVAAAVINAAKDSERGSASAMVLALRLLGMTVALTALTDFAINRVNRLVQERSAGLTDMTSLYVDTAFEVGREIMLLGAFVAFITVLVAWNMRGGQSSDAGSAILATPTRTERRRTPDITEREGRAEGTRVVPS
ncbi:MAG: MFS transporter [Anaerolineales bacterium]